MAFHMEVDVTLKFLDWQRREQSSLASVASLVEMLLTLHHGRGTWLDGQGLR